VKQFKKILVGVSMTPDTTVVSPASRKAAKQALWLAQQTGGCITLFHSTWREDLERHVGPCPEIGEALEALASWSSDSGVSTNVVYGRQRPWLDMTERALSAQNDIIVIARRNEAESTEGRVGTNARKLLRNCPCPVWLVHPTHELVHKLVLAATDLTQVGARATRLAASLARAFNCQLHIIHAWQLPPELNSEKSRLSDCEFQERIELVRDDIAEEVFRGLDCDGEGTRPQLHMPCTSPSKGIESTLHELDPDLIVMGSVSRSGIPGMLMGNTAERLVDRIACSLLTVKPDEFVSPVPR